MTKIKLCSIAAMAENHAIGKDNDLLWHIPVDFQHFKDTTMNKPIIMGRKTFESLPGILKGRTHIVVTRSKFEHPDAVTTHSLDEAIAKAKGIAEKDGENEAFVIGGGEIYKQTMPIIDRLYITVVHKAYDGDTYFPEFDWDEWNITHEDRREAERNTPAFTFYTLDRKA